MWAILPIREWRCQDIDQVLLHEIIFFLSVFSSSQVLAKITLSRSKLLSAAWWSREEKRGNCEANLLYVESDFGTADITDKSFTVFFACWGVKLDRRVKILAHWVRWFDWHWVTSAVEAKEQLAIILFRGFWFPCFNAIWYDLWCHFAWRLKFR